MSGGLVSAFVLPHDFRSPQQSPLPPHQQAYTPTMSSRKRKVADDDLDLSPDRMSSSPSPSPATLPLSSTTTPRNQAHTKNIKRPRTNNTTGRPLPLPRLLETLSASDMRTLLRTLCTSNPSIAATVSATAPRPTVPAALSVLEAYQAAFRASFPYGDRPSSEYAFNRVRAPLLALLDALRDFTPQFLPPNETQAATSLTFLDGATAIVHALPEWDSYVHDRHKAEAYEEISAAWAHVLREAAKRGGGIQIQYGGWDRKIVRHNEISGGRMMEAVNELRACCGWINSGGDGGRGGGGGENGYGGQEVDEQRMAVRQQLMAGTYGMNMAVSVGDRW